MTNSRKSADYDDTDDLLMNDDAEFIEDDVEEEQEERRGLSRNVNMDMRHRIEDRLEERRLERELNEYEFFDIEEDETLH